MDLKDAYSRKQLNLYSKIYKISAIIFIIFGALCTIPVPPFGIIVLIIGIGMLLLSKKFKNVSKNGDFNPEIENFVSTNEVGSYIKFNDTNKTMLISPKFMPKIIKYSDIIDFELVEDGKTIVTKGGLGRAIAGGVIFGGVGAVVGGVTGKRKSNSTVKALRVKVIVNDMKNPNIYINLLSSPTKVNSFIYKTSYETAQKILSMLEIITKDSNSNLSYTNDISDKSSIADELIKLNKLVNSGILTEEEFESQKSKLLNN